MSVLGGGLSAGLLLILPEVSFDVAVPWLLAFATAVPRVRPPSVQRTQRPSTAR
jgi:hypothetical protein